MALFGRMIPPVLADDEGNEKAVKYVLGIMYDDLTDRSYDVWHVKPHDSLSDLMASYARFRDDEKTGAVIALAVYECGTCVAIDHVAKTGYTRMTIGQLDVTGYPELCFRAYSCSWPREAALHGMELRDTVASAADEMSPQVVHPNDPSAQDKCKTSGTDVGFGGVYGAEPDRMPHGCSHELCRFRVSLDHLNESARAIWRQFVATYRRINGMHKQGADGTEPYSEPEIRFANLHLKMDMAAYRADLEFGGPGDDRRILVTTWTEAEVVAAVRYIESQRADKRKAAPSDRPL